VEESPVRRDALASMASKREEKRSRQLLIDNEELGHRFLYWGGQSQRRENKKGTVNETFYGKRNTNTAKVYRVICWIGGVLSFVNCWEKRSGSPAVQKKQLVVRKRGGRV